MIRPILAALAVASLALCAPVRANDAAPAREATHDHAHDGHSHSGGHVSVHTHPGMDFSVWENVAVQEGGIKKSLYTYATETMRELAGGLEYKGLGPMEGLFSMAFETHTWAHEPILRLRHPALRELFGDNKHISPIELEEKRSEWLPLVQKYRKDKDGETLKDKDGNPVKTLRATEIESELQGLFHHTNQLVTREESLALVPTADFRGENTEWRTFDELFASRKPEERELASQWIRVRDAYVSGDAATFNSASATLVAKLRSLDAEHAVPQWRTNLDRWDSKTMLFVKAGWVYLASGLMFLVSYLAGRRMLSLAAGGTLALGAALHVVALVVRGILAGRTPVSNLYESAVFIVASMTILAVVISAYYRTRVVGMAGGFLGAFFMGIANNIPLHYGVKIMPLVDALQSYWLHIHVTSMLISYAFFALAFFVASAWLVRSFVLSRAGKPTAEDAGLQFLDALNFRIITVGFPVLTAGVILGAVWAAEAWGRPWAFDPKETAAAITWMIYALYLHCRLFMGWKGQKGIWLSILGFGAVVFTYIGVSFFLSGLHSYVSEEGVSFGSFFRGIYYSIF